MLANLLGVVIASYTLCVIFLFLQSSTGNNFLLVWADFILKTGFIIHTAVVGLRWYAAGRPPFANMHEALVLFGWSIIFIYIVYDRIYKIKFMAKAVGILAVLILVFAASADNTVGQLMPALQSRWITIHVVSYFIGYAAMSLSVICGLYYLVIRKIKDKKGDRLESLDDLGYYFILFAFPFLTIGMTTGSIWANVAWGTYWNWDPKETCSLITWMVYALYLHLRIFKGLKGEKAAWLSIIGYFAVLFTFVGVNFILPGLHSYS